MPKLQDWSSVGLRRLGEEAGEAGERECGELRRAVGLSGFGLCPKSKCVFANLCECVSGPNPAGWGGRGAGGPEQRPDGAALASSGAPIHSS